MIPQEKYLQPSLTSTMELFCENSYRFFRKKATSKMFDWVPNTLFAKINLSKLIKIHTRLLTFRFQLMWYTNYLLSRNNRISKVLLLRKLAQCWCLFWLNSARPLKFTYKIVNYFLVFFFNEKLRFGAAHLKNVHFKLGLSFKANFFKAILKAPFQLCGRYVINNQKPWAKSWLKNLPKNHNSMFKQFFGKSKLI